jgi:hypothetical protein
MFHCAVAVSPLELRRLRVLGCVLVRVRPLLDGFFRLFRVRRYAAAAAAVLTIRRVRVSVVDSPARGPVRGGLLAHITVVCAWFAVDRASSRHSARDCAHIVTVRASPHHGGCCVRFGSKYLHRDARSSPWVDDVRSLAGGVRGVSASRHSVSHVVGPWWFVVRGASDTLGLPDRLGDRLDTGRLELDVLCVRLPPLVAGPGSIRIPRRPLLAAFRDRFPWQRDARWAGHPSG